MELNKPVCKLIGEDGNIFNLVGIAMRTLKENDDDTAAETMCKRGFASGSYEEALSVIGDYVTIV